MVRYHPDRGDTGQRAGGNAGFNPGLSRQLRLAVSADRMGLYPLIYARVPGPSVVVEKTTTLLLTNKPTTPLPRR